MTNFFRRTRKNFAYNKRLFKYLYYVTGEIVLVVIGILIALKINNWNEAQKTEQEEINTLVNLLDNLYRAQEQSEYFIVQEKKLKQSLLLALGKSSKGADFIQYISDSVFYELLWNFEANVPVINAYSDIKSTGKVAIIRNAEIRKNFTNLEASINVLKFFVSDRITVQQLRVDNIAEREVNFVRLLNTQDPEVNIDNELTNDYRSILSNPKTRNLLAIKLELTNKVIRYREGLGMEINDLILLLRTELETR